MREVDRPCLDAADPLFVAFRDLPIMPSKKRAGCVLALVAILNVTHSEAAAFPHANGVWDATFFAPGVDGGARAVVADENRVYVAGPFRTAGDVVADRIAMWDRTTHRWTALASRIVSAGSDVFVTDLALLDGQLYAAGEFTRIDGVSVRNVARWDGVHWHAAGSELKTPVWKLRTLNGALYAFGDFTCTQIAGCGGMSRWNGQKWENVFFANDAVTDGVNTYIVTPYTVRRWDGAQFHEMNWDPEPWYFHNPPRALAVYQGSLYVGGTFAGVGNEDASNIARWDGTSWHKVGGGLMGSVEHLAATGEALYATMLVNENYSSRTVVMRWDGTTWTQLGEPVLSYSAGDQILDLEAYGDTVFLAGVVPAIDDAAIHNVGWWDEASANWHSVSDERGVGVNGFVWSAAAVGDELFVGGEFNYAGNTAVPFAAAWNGTSWRWVGQGAGGPIYRIASGAPGTFAAGYFQTEDGVFSGIGTYDGSKWSPTEIEGTVDDLLIVGDKLYAAGGLRIAGVSVPLLMFDGIAWSSLIDAETVGSIRSLAYWNSSLFIGGGFDSIGDLEIAKLAEQRDASWAMVGGGIAGSHAYIDSMAAFRDGLYVSGHFDSAGGQPATNLARWNGTDWEPIHLGDYDSGPSLTVGGGSLYAGPWLSVLRRNTAEWEQLGAPFDAEGRIALLGDEVYAYGGFASVGHRASPYLAHWLTCEAGDETCTPTTTTTTTSTTTTTTAQRTTTSTTESSSTTFETTTTLPGFLCGDANHDGDVTASDALLALRTAVGTGQCDLLDCDLDGNLMVATRDALAILRLSAGLNVPFACS